MHRLGPLLRYASPRRCTQRGRYFSSITQQDVNYFSSILSSPTSILSTLAEKSPVAQSDLDVYNTDWMGKYKGKTTTVVKPRTTKEVSLILKYCYERDIAVVPQGGNTGLVGGSIPLQDELVISLGAMTNIRSFDPVSGAVYTLSLSC
jgi:hypothetical protein